MKALIFANGTPEDGEMVRQALVDGGEGLLIAADGGARIAWFYDKTPHSVIGDMDSLAPEEIQMLEAAGAVIQRYPADKNETDLELALLYAVKQDAGWIRVIGASGGRFDQILANVYLLALPQLAGCDVALVAGAQIIRLLHPGDHVIEGEVGDTISLIPVSGDVLGITTAHLKYPLSNEQLSFGPARGVSNVMKAEQAHISLVDGLLLCVHTRGRA